MELTGIFITNALGGKDDAVSSSIVSLRDNLGLLDKIMLAAPEFINALGQLDGDHTRARFNGYVSLLWLHSMAIRDTLLIARDGGTRMWNAPALAVHARAIQDCFTGFHYFCIEKVNGDEREMRNLLWFRQALYKRTQLAKEVPGTKIPAELAKSLAADAASLAEVEGRLQNSRRVKQIEKSNPGLAKNILKKRDLIFAEDQGDIWVRAGFDDGQFKQTWIYLSQAVHSTPFAVSSILNFRAGTDDWSPSVVLPVLLSIWSFSKAVRCAVDATPALEPHARKILELADSFTSVK